MTRGTLVLRVLVAPACVAAFLLGQQSRPGAEPVPVHEPPVVASTAPPVAPPDVSPVPQQEVGSDAIHASASTMAPFTLPPSVSDPSTKASDLRRPPAELLARVPAPAAEWVFEPTEAGVAAMLRAHADGLERRCFRNPLLPGKLTGTATHYLWVDPGLGRRGFAFVQPTPETLARIGDRRVHPQRMVSECIVKHFLGARALGEVDSSVPWTVPLSYGYPLSPVPLPRFEIEIPFLEPLPSDEQARPSPYLDRW